MALSSYFLVTTQHSLPEIRRAGFLYLLIAHVGAIAMLLELRRHAGGQLAIHLRCHACRAPRPPLGADRLPARAVRFRRQGGTGAAARVAAGSSPRRALARLGTDERRDAEDRGLRPAARHFRSARRGRMVVGAGAARARAAVGGVRRGVRGGADRHEAPARLFVHRERRHHFHRPRACDRVPRCRHERARRARSHRAALPLSESRVHEEPAVPGHRGGAALDRRAQSRSARRPHSSHAVGRLAHAGRYAGAWRVCRR